MRKRTLVMVGFLALAGGNALLLGALTDEQKRVRALIDDKRDLTRRLSYVSEQEHEQQERLQRLRRTIASDEEPASPAPPGEAGAATSALEGLSREHRKTLALRAHGETLRELNLSPEQRDALLDAIVTQEYRTAQGLADLRHDDEPSAEEQRVVVAAQQGKYKEDVARAIGQEKAAQFEALERKQPAMAEVKVVRESLDAAGVPIDEAQRSRLMSILSRPDFQAEPDGLSLEPGGASGALPRWRRERSKRFQQEAASVLTPQQLAQLEAFQAADDALAEIRSKTSNPVAYVSGGATSPAVP